MSIVTRACVVLLVLSAFACAGNGNAPSSNSRVIGLSGNLSFGTVTIGQEASTTLTIANTGNATLTVTGMTVPPGSGAVYSASWTNGTIPPFGSQQTTIYFAPAAAVSYAGTLQVNGDQTGGTNTIGISGTGRAVVLGPEAFCATIPSVGFGHFFYCATNQTNLNLAPFPDGSHGFCQTASTNNLGLVGYVAYTFNGGIFTVESQSTASAQCNALGSQCAGYLMCTRQ